MDRACYVRATPEGLPAGEQRIVFDKCHVMGDMTAAIDLARKRSIARSAAPQRGRA